jgi:hypothetical protein
LPALAAFKKTSAADRKSAPGEATAALFNWLRSGYNTVVTHQQLVRLAEQWLRRKYRCGIVLSEQSCASGETPDVIGWKGKCRSVLVECKISRADFLADQEKPFRRDPGLGMGCERFYLAPAGLIAQAELPQKWGLLECKGREVRLAVRPSRTSQRGETGLILEMNLLLASLRRVEVRIEPQTITDFLKWKNRLAEYNGGRLPQGVDAPEMERNVYIAGPSRAEAASSGNLSKPRGITLNN